MIVNTFFTLIHVALQKHLNLVENFPYFLIAINISRNSKHIEHLTFPRFSYLPKTFSRIFAYEIDIQLFQYQAIYLITNLRANEEGTT